MPPAPFPWPYDDGGEPGIQIKASTAGHYHSAREENWEDISPMRNPESILENYDTRVEGQRPNRADIAPN